MTAGCPDDETLSGYWDRECATSEADGLQAHLRACPKCRRRIRELKATRFALRDMPVPPMPEDLRRALRRLGSEVSVSQRRRRNTMRITFSDAASLYVADRDYYLRIENEYGQKSQMARVALNLVKARMRAVSTFAAPLLYQSQRAKVAESELWDDHIVPLKKIHNWILGSSRTSATEKWPEHKAIEAIIKRHLAVARITCEENRRLDEAGLKEEMPEGWSWGDDVLARYSPCEIQIESWELRK